MKSHQPVLDCVWGALLLSGLLSFHILLLLRPPQRRLPIVTSSHSFYSLSSFDLPGPLVGRLLVEVCGGGRRQETNLERSGFQPLLAQILLRNIRGLPSARGSKRRTRLSSLGKFRYLDSTVDPVHFSTHLPRKETGTSCEQPQ